MKTSLIALLTATSSIAFLHALAPDHWLPFVVIGRAQRWSKLKLALVTLVAGIGHVASSIFLGLLGLMIGIGLAKLKGFESIRGEIGIWLLIGFGIGYALWGLKHIKHPHHHHIVDDKILTRRTVTIWTLFAIFILGPCEPLIPLMFVSMNLGEYGLLLVILVFSLITWVMMITQSLIGYIGLRMIKLEKLERYSHVVAGLVIALTGVFIMLSV
jgi:hypothetical protein